MERLSPTLVVFLAHWGGLIAGGLLGPVHAAASMLFLGGLAHLFGRLLGVPSSSTLRALGAVALLGPFSLALHPALEAPGAGLPSPAEPVWVEVRVTEVRRRDPVATEALVEVLRLEDPSGTARLSEERRALLRVRGMANLWATQTLAFRARHRHPLPRSEVLGPRWPEPDPLPTLTPTGDLVPLKVPGLPERGRWDRLRLHLARRITQRLQGPEAAVALAVTLGEGRSVPDDLRQDLADLGTAHLLCVSGLHVTAASWLAGLLLIRLIGPVLVRRRPETNLVALQRTASLIAATAFAALAGLPVSALRAVGMFAAASLGAALGRPSSLANSLGIAGLCNLVLDPTDAFSLSFGLSYGALLGLALWNTYRDHPTPSFRGLWLRIRHRIVEGFWASLAATLGTTPWTLLFFGQASLVAPLVNLLVLPAFSLLVMPSLLAFLVLCALSPAGADIVAPAVQSLLHFFLESQASLATVVPVLRNPSPLLLLVCLVVLALLWGLMLGVPGRRLPYWALAGLGLWATLPRDRDRPPPGSLVLEVLSIGKGDALLIHCPDGRQWLVDTGESRTSERLIRELGRRGVRRLRGLILTHGDEDHIGGAPILLRSLEVEEMRVPCPVLGDPSLHRILGAARSTPVRCLHAGMEAIPSCGGPTTVLWPPPGEDLHGNEASLVFPLSLANRTILLTGDLEIAQEARLLESGMVPRADVLKLGHHGSPGSSSREFLRAVAPTWALVSGYRTRRQAGTSPETRKRVDEIGAHWLDSTPLGGIRVILTPDGTVSAGGNRTPGPWRQ